MFISVSGLGVAVSTLSVCSAVVLLVGEVLRVGAAVKGAGGGGEGDRESGMPVVTVLTDDITTGLCEVEGEGVIVVREVDVLMLRDVVLVLGWTTTVETATTIEGEGVEIGGADCVVSVFVDSGVVENVDASISLVDVEGLGAVVVIVMTPDATAGLFGPLPGPDLREPLPLFDEVVVTSKLSSTPSLSISGPCSRESDVVRNGMART